MTAAAYDQVDFRGREDDGSETAASWIDTAGSNWTQTVDANFRVRFLIQEVAGGMTNNQEFKFQYNLAGAGENDITTTSSVVRAFGSGNFTDDAATTEQMAGSQTFFTGAMNDDDLVGEATQLDFTSSSETEIEGCFQIRGVDVSDAQTLTIRVVESNGTTFAGGHTSPTITVDKPAGGLGIPIAMHHYKTMAC